MAQLPADFDLLYFAYINGCPAPHAWGELFKGVYVWAGRPFRSPPHARGVVPLPNLLRHTPLPQPLQTGMVTFIA